MKEILLNIESKEIRYATLQHGKLYDLVIERKKTRQLTGNIYRGRVTNILHNIQSAFIDIGEGENGFIHISDILENRQKFQEMFDMDFELEERESAEEQKDVDISKVMKIEQPVLVQVVKEPIGSKGARLTSNVSIAGRYLVLLPNTPHRGVSRKIEERSVRERLKQTIRAFEMPQDMGLICRTACVNASTEQLVDEAHELLKTWEQIVENFQSASKPTLLYQESDLIKRAIITAIDKKYDRILTDDYPTYQLCKRTYEKYRSDHVVKIEFYRDKTPMFERFNVEREIDKALRRKIWLSGGGYLFFDRTEAMYTIDVNSGRSTQQSAKSDVESALLHINMEAADEIARQLRLRNIGGLIICDFIDMRSRKNQKRILEHLKEAMKEDSAKCTILGMSEFGLIEMTRQRSRESLTQTMFTSCPYCSGTGLIKTHESVSIEIERDLKKLISQNNDDKIEIITHPEVSRHIDRSDRDFFQHLADKSNLRIEYRTDDNLHLNDFYFFSKGAGQKIDV
jgi:ribonuclease G